MGEESRFDAARHRATLSLLAAVRLPSECVVLDVGCRSGKACLALTSILNAPSIVGADIDSVALGGCDRGHMSPIRATADHLPIRSGVVDLVLAMEVVEHLDISCYVISEASRILRPGGFLLISTPNRASITGLTGRLAGRLLGKPWNAWDLTHRRLLTPSELVAELFQWGFVLRDARGFWFIPDLPIVSRYLAALADSSGLPQFSGTALGVRLGFVTIALAQKSPSVRGVQGNLVRG